MKLANYWDLIFKLKNETCQILSSILPSTLAHKGSIKKISKRPGSFSSIVDNNDLGNFGCNYN